MKRTNETKVMAVAVLLSASLTHYSVMAQDFGGEDVFNSDQIDIDGVYQKKESAADRIEKMRKQLERKNEEMVQKKIEDIRINQEKKLANQLQDAFNGNGSLNGGDQVSTMQAAPQRIVAPEPMPLPAAPEVAEEKKTRVVPGFGVSQFNGEGIDSLESEPVLNLAIESMVSKRFVVGVGVSYTKMDIIYYRDYNLNNYFTSYLQGDEVAYKNWNLNINGKFFLSTGTVKPFLGLGLGYNRTTLTLEEREKEFVYQQSNRNLKEATATGTGATGTGMVGAEFSFSDSIGMTADFRFTKALTNGFAEKSKTYRPTNQDALDKASLKRLGHDLDNSDIASLNLGLLIKF